MAAADRRYITEHGPIEFPPAPLRLRVVGVCDVPGFETGGANTRREIEAALHQVGKSMSDFTNALDFGCGCGRTLCAFRDRPPGLALCGSDIDAEAIQWCQSHLPFAEFRVNDGLPPTRYATGQFDLVWSLSVFTHLNEQFQCAWLQELQRIVQPGGYLVVSVHGAHAWRGLPVWEVARIKRKGFVFARVPSLKHVFPEWYQTAWHTRDYIEQTWGRYFALLSYIPRGLGEYQDVVVMRNDNTGLEVKQRRR